MFSNLHAVSSITYTTSCNINSSPKSGVHETAALPETSSNVPRKQLLYVHASDISGAFSCTVETDVTIVQSITGVCDSCIV